MFISCFYLEIMEVEQLHLAKFILSTNGVARKIKMKQEMNCPICYEKVYSEISKGCKLCGMALEDEGKDFCSKICRGKYEKIQR